MSSREKGDGFSPVVFTVIVLGIVLLYAFGVSTFVIQLLDDEEAAVVPVVADSLELVDIPVVAETPPVIIPHIQPKFGGAIISDGALKDQEEAKKDSGKAFRPDIKIVWQHFLGRGSQNYVFITATDGDENTYVGGRFQGTLIIPTEGTGQTFTSSDRDGFLLKIGPNGAPLWWTILSDPGYGNVSDLVVGPDGDIVIVGANTSLPFLARYSKSGTMKWSITLSGNAGSWASSLAVGLDGEIYVGGLLSSAVDFDAGSAEFMLSPGATWDIFLARFEKDGEFSWAFRLGNGRSSTLMDLAVDKHGDILVTGNFKGQLDADPRNGVSLVGSGPGMNTFVGKYDRSGRHMWSTSPESGGNVMAASLITVGDEFHVGGHFTHFFAAGVGSHKQNLRVNNAPGDWDMFVLTYSLDGSLISARRWGTQLPDKMSTLRNNSALGLVLAGQSGDRVAVGIEGLQDNLMQLPADEGGSTLPGLPAPIRFWMTIWLWPVLQLNGPFAAKATFSLAATEFCSIGKATW